MMRLLYPRMQGLPDKPIITSELRRILSLLVRLSSHYQKAGEIDDTR